MSLHGFVGTHERQPIWRWSWSWGTLTICRPVLGDLIQTYAIVVAWAVFGFGAALLVMLACVRIEGRT